MPTLTHAGADWIKSAIRWFVVRESSMPSKIEQIWNKGNLTVRCGRINAGSRPAIPCRILPGSPEAISRSS